MERVSKVQAVKLKELGYDVPCIHYYYADGYVRGDKSNHNNVKNRYSRPYLDEVIDWLDGKGVYVIPKPSTYVNQSTGNIEVAWMVAVYSSKEIDDFTMPWQQFGHLTRTTAKSAGIDKALDILSQQNSKNGNND